MLADYLEHWWGYYLVAKRVQSSVGSTVLNSVGLSVKYLDRPMAEKLAKN